MTHLQVVVVVVVVSSGGLGHVGHVEILYKSGRVVVVVVSSVMFEIPSNIIHTPSGYALGSMNNVLVNFRQTTPIFILSITRLNQEEIFAALGGTRTICFLGIHVHV